MVNTTHLPVNRKHCSDAAQEVRYECHGGGHCALAIAIGLVPIHSDTLILKTRPTELRVAPSGIPRASCGHGR